MTTHTPHSPAINSRAPSPAQRARELAERFARMLRGPEPKSTPAADQDTIEWLSVPPTEAEEVLPRFPYARRGYDCAAVDEYVAGLEHELAELDGTLAELRGRVETDAVSSEIKRLGEETSSVLIAAHETREEMLRDAQTEAERRLAEASQQASAILSEQEARTRELEARNEGLRQERERLLGNVRTISKALADVADSTV